MIEIKGTPKSEALREAFFSITNVKTAVKGQHFPFFVLFSGTLMCYSVSHGADLPLGVSDKLRRILSAGLGKPRPLCSSRREVWDDSRWRGRLFDAMNLRRVLFKLQTAINTQQDRRIKVNQIQTWSEKLGRMVTKYMIVENGLVLLESYKTEEVVKLLVEMLGGG